MHALPGLDRETAGTIAALFVDLVAEPDFDADPTALHALSDDALADP
jgi:hypothetical protein